MPATNKISRIRKDRRHRAPWGYRPGPRRYGPGRQRRRTLNGLQFGLRFTTVQRRPGSTGQGRPIPKLIVRTLGKGSHERIPDLASICGNP